MFPVILWKCRATPLLQKWDIDNHPQSLAVAVGPLFRFKNIHSRFQLSFYMMQDWSGGYKLDKKMFYYQILFSKFNVLLLQGVQQFNTETAWSILGMLFKICVHFKHLHQYLYLRDAVKIDICNNGPVAKSELDIIHMCRRNLCSKWCFLCY